MSPGELVEEHMGWSRQVAIAAHRRLSPLFELADLIQAAHLGLWRAALAYRVEQNPNFRGFAFSYVRGAVYGAIRRSHFTAATTQSLEYPTDRLQLLNTGTVRVTNAGTELIDKRAPHATMISSETRAHRLAVQRHLVEAMRYFTRIERHVVAEYLVAGRPMAEVMAEIDRGVATGFAAKRTALAKMREHLTRRGIRGASAL